MASSPPTVQHAVLLSFNPQLSNWSSPGMLCHVCCMLGDVCCNIVLVTDCTADLLVAMATGWCVQTCRQGAVRAYMMLPRYSVCQQQECWQITRGLLLTDTRPWVGAASCCVGSMVRSRCFLQCCSSMQHFCPCIPVLASAVISTLFHGSCVAHLFLYPLPEGVQGADTCYMIAFVPFWLDHRPSSPQASWSRSSS